MTVRTTYGNTRRAAAPPAFRLHGTPYKAVLTAHILTSVGWFGLAIAVVFCAVAAGISDDPAFAHSCYRVMEKLPVVTLPLGLAAIASGALLGLGTTWGLFRYWWVVIKIVLAAAVVVTDAAIVGNVAHTAATTGEVLPPLYGATVAHVVVLALATILSVFKPRWLTPWRQASLRTG